MFNLTFTPNLNSTNNIDYLDQKFLIVLELFISIFFFHFIIIVFHFILTSIRCNKKFEKFTLNSKINQV